MRRQHYLEMVAEAPDGSHSRDSHGVRLILTKTKDCALQEGCDGLGLEMTRELAGNPETSAKEKRMDGTVEISQDHVCHEAADIKLQPIRSQYLQC